MFNSTRTTQLLVGALLLGTTSMASAVVSSVYGGVSCLPLKESGYEFERFPNGAMANKSSNSRTWMCPMVRQHTLSNVKSATVIAYDRNTLSNVSCTLRTIYANGAYGYYQNKKTSGTPNTAVLSFGSKTALAKGAVTLACSVPGDGSGAVNASGIKKYELVEY